MNGYVTKIQKFSVHDGPGIRTTVFLKGCPLACSWCQNPETIFERPDVMFNSVDCIGCKKCIEVCPKDCFSWKDSTVFRSDKCDQCGLCVENCPVGALQWSSREMSSKEVLVHVMQDKAFYDRSGGGMTLSGGEPLNQLDFSCDLASKAKAAGLHVVVDTSGHVPFAAFEKIRPFADLYLYDIKLFDASTHKKYTGRSNELILENFQKLCRSGAEIIVRVPLIPGVTDAQENIRSIKSFVEGCKKGIKIEQIPFNLLAEEKYRMIGKKYSGRSDQ